jgi:secreted trypsin-like serine protease
MAYNRLFLIMLHIIRLIGFLFLLTASHVNAAPTNLYAKIIGGKIADSNAWPWMTALIYSDTDNLVFCGGSLIASNWVLTAAHCMFDEYPTGSGHYIPTAISSFDVLINRPQLSAMSGERLHVAKVVIHPGFDHDYLTNDVALLQLSTPSSVTPIETLPDFSSLDESGQSAIALGWGTTSTAKNPSLASFPDNLHQVTLPIISNELCRSKLTGIENSMLCAGLPTGGVDTCYGDSGGPLVVFDNERGIWQQAGITSFGESRCAARGFYGVYTRLDMFKAFISSTVCSAEQTPPAPTLKLSVNNTVATATWSTSPMATGYRLNYAPYPAGTPSYSLKPEQLDHFSTALPKGSAFYVSITAYRGNCRSDFSNTVPVIIR